MIFPPLKYFEAMIELSRYKAKLKLENDLRIAKEEAYYYENESELSKIIK